ncbi:membrane protein [Sulfurimicrobium lacus]|uniref:Membrane protein n=1 Tax=Sulfurimicrobium lacus TaxID=2715678 RepID=A0A6F8VA11_9PROT|nr:DUF2269 domain-containing protein [Sulfurimicrobium lacus]BCB26683.1 membrane protein [Sulfurimicrobium lacus]
MSYLLLKYLHILSMVLLFGTGLGSAFYKWMADRSRNVAHIADTSRHVVLADWLFTTPTVIFQPVSGIWLLQLAGIPLDTPWVVASLSLYLLAGVCWLPVVALQIRMRNLAQQAALTQTDLPARYWQDARLWFWLGVPAFSAMVIVVFLMVFKTLHGA